MFETAAYCADEFVIEPSMLAYFLSVLLHSPCSSYRPSPIHGSLANDSKSRLYLNLSLGDRPPQKSRTSNVRSNAVPGGGGMSQPRQISFENPRLIILRV
jgi:hypothetical protein